MTTPTATSTASVTVAVATLGRPAEAWRCVAAILTGALVPAELLVVDQSEDDETELRFRDAPVPPFVRVIRQSRRGLSASRNLAIASSSQPIIVFTDDDCVPSPGWVAAVVGAFADDRSLAAVTGAVHDLGPDEPGTRASSLRRGKTASEFRGRALPWKVGTGGNMAVRRDWFARIGLFDERLGAGSEGKSAEDMDLIFRLLAAGASIRYEPTAVVFHARHPIATRLRSRWTYGFGMGAFCGKWIRRHRVEALRILVHWYVPRLRLLLGAIVRRRGGRVHEETLYLAGATAGLFHGVISLGHAGADPSAAARR